MPVAYVEHHGKCCRRPGLNIINDPKCNKVLNIITFCPKCNKLLRLITLGLFVKTVEKYFKDINDVSNTLF